MHHSTAVESGLVSLASSLLAVAILAFFSVAEAAAGVSTPVGASGADTTPVIAGNVENASQLDDGVVLIKQPASFPYYITRPGSYRLEGNLRVPTGASGIVITANNVTLDLGGFAVLASGSCAGSPCNVIGIDVRGSSATTVKNGSISGFSNSILGGVGISIGPGSGALLEELHLTGNDVGIVTAANTIVRKSTIDSNQNGIFINGRSSLIESNTVSGASNQGSGIAVFGGGAMVSGNIIENLTQGIVVYGPGYSGSGRLLYSSNFFQRADGAADVTNGGGGVAISLYNNLCSNGSQC
jgi:hypothetical protein